MGRLVEASSVSEVELTSGQKSSTEGYAERTAKYIPSEIIATYISLINIVKSVDPTDELRIPVAWGIFIICLVTTPVYLKLLSENKNTVKIHLVISTIAFIIWGYALGGPFELSGYHKPWLGAILLGLFTLLAGLIIPKK
ncbi:MAG: hypothetical protein V3U87_15410 [Methylococcaceae bacterium]